MEQIHEMLQRTFYMPVLLFVSCLISIIIQIVNPSNLSFRKPILFYSVTFIIVFFLGLFSIAITENNFLRARILELANATVALIEFSVFGYYFHKILNSKLFSILISCTIAVLLFFLITLHINTRYAVTEPENIISATDTIISLEMVMLIILCLAYFYKIIN